MTVLNLLRENSQNIEVLHENTSEGKNLYIEGVFAQAETKNGNGRVYPYDVMEAAVAKFNEDYVSKRRAGGEINHPDRPFIDPNFLAARVVEYRMDGNNVYGKALILNTIHGQQVKGVIEGGFALGVSTRGMGSLKEKRDGTKEVQADFFKTAVDIVDNPSGPDCYPEAIYESKWALNESTGVWVPMVNEEEDIKFNEQMFLEKVQDYFKSLSKVK